VAGPGSLVRTGYDFTGWNTAPGGTGTPVTAGASLTMTADITLYAQWQTSPPRPPVPASAPTALVLMPGDSSAIASWDTPKSSGTFAVTHYQVTSEPRGGSCLALAPTTTCELTGLTNGVSYGVRVRALTGAGWGTWSEAESVTPQRVTSLVISGTRDGATVRVVGVVSGATLDVVQVMRRFPGQPEYSPATTSHIGRSEGSITWERRTRKKVYVYVMGTTLGGQTVTSNRVIIAKMQR